MIFKVQSAVFLSVCTLHARKQHGLMHPPGVRYLGTWPSCLQIGGVVAAS